MFHPAVGYIVFLCFPFGLVPIAAADLCGEFLWTSVSPLVSDCGREGPLCALLEVYRLPFVVCGLFAGLRLGLLVVSALLTRLLWRALAAVASFWGSLLDLCVEPSPGFLGSVTSYPLLLLWH